MFCSAKAECVFTNKCWLLPPLKMLGVLYCTILLCGTEGVILCPSVLMHIILGCHLKPPRFAPVCKTLLWFLWDKGGGWVREMEGERVRDSSEGARPISSISSREHADIPVDTGAKRLVALLPNSLRHTGERDVEIYVMVTQSFPLLNSPSPLTAQESEGEFKSRGAAAVFAEQRWTETDTMFPFCCFYLICRGCSDLYVSSKWCVSLDVCVFSSVFDMW